MMEEAILSPRAHMAEAGGPRNAMLALWSRSGSLGFSEAWPHPAHTACTHTHVDIQCSEMKEGTWKERRHKKQE